MASKRPTVGNELLLELRRVGDHQVDAAALGTVERGPAAEGIVLHGQRAPPRVRSLQRW
jgi:hypothetical protein